MPLAKRPRSKSCRTSLFLPMARAGALTDLIKWIYYSGMSVRELRYHARDRGLTGNFGEGRGNRCYGLYYQCR